MRKGLSAIAVGLAAVVASGGGCGPPDGEGDGGDGGRERGDAGHDGGDGGGGGDIGDGATDAAPPCTSDFDCLSPYLCEETCVAPCGAERSCETGYLCTEATGHCALAPGCSGLTWRSFARDFTAQYCVRCHGGFTDLEIVRSVAPSVVEQVVSGAMPGSCPCPTQAEREDLRTWVECGMPR